MNASRVLRLSRHPMASGVRWLQRTTHHYRLPVGRVASMRRLLRKAFAEPGRALVIGPTDPVRQAWPAARLDVVGTTPGQADVTVVSDAMGTGSLPKRWDLVVLTEAAPPKEKLRAAAEACLPGGALVVVASRSAMPLLPQQAKIDDRLRSQKVQLVVARVPG